MALTLSVLKQTETMAIVKVYGTASSYTVTLNTDLLSPTTIVQGTPTVNIIGVTWFVSSGASDAITVTRGGTPVMNLYMNGQLDLAGNNGISDTVGNTSDIAVTIAGTGAIYLVLRKAAGYKSKIEPEIFGQYDSTTAVGS